MSLEAKLEEATKAIVALTAALHAVGINTPATKPEAPQRDVKAPAPKAEAEPKPEAKAPATTPAPLNYEEDVKPRALLVAGKGGRDALIKACQDAAGVNSPKDAKPEQYAALVAEFDRVLAS